jgi:hypothetical protein
VRLPAWTFGCLTALGCNNSSSTPPAPPAPAPSTATSSAPSSERIPPWPEPPAERLDGLECDDGHDPHPPPSDAGGISLEGFGDRGGGPCWFSDIHGQVEGLTGDGARAVGRAACGTFEGLRSCYEAARGPKKTDHPGTVLVSMRVGQDGAIVQAHSTESSVGDAHLVACTVAALRAARPAIEARGARFDYEVRFTPKANLGVCAGR